MTDSTEQTREEPDPEEALVLTGPDAVALREAIAEHRKNSDR